MSWDWLQRYRDKKYGTEDQEFLMDDGPRYEVPKQDAAPGSRLYSERASNNHDRHNGTHVSPYDNGKVWVGLEGLEVRLIQGIDEAQFQTTMRRALRATIGIHPDSDLEMDDPEEMLRGGLQTALETQVVVFEVIRASRALTHQLVRSRRAVFHQQSQRATWYGDRPDVRISERVYQNSDVLDAFELAQEAAWRAYQMACDAGISYESARYILPEGTVNYILCEYPLSEFLAVYAYRACSMFQPEMVYVMREMRRVLVEEHPFLEPYVKISCEKGTDCATCKGAGAIQHPWTNESTETVCPDCKGIGSNRKCTYQGWENVEAACDFPQAKQGNRVFLPDPRHRIG